jgi:hypothetical protein
MAGQDSQEDELAQVEIDFNAEEENFDDVCE